MSSAASSSPSPAESRAEEVLDDDFNWDSEANFDQLPDSLPDSPRSLNRQSSYGSLTLAPINQNNNSDHLPSLNNPEFFQRNRDYEQYHNFSPVENDSPPLIAQDHAPGADLLSSSSQFGILDDFELESWVWDRTPPLEMASSGNGRVTRSNSTVVDLTSSPGRGVGKGGRKRKAESPEDRPLSKIARKDSSSSTEADLENVQLVDLSGVDDSTQYEQLRAKEQAESIKQQALAQANKPVKLAEFQCIICMDNPTDLTITHCGHLFCSECLHQALHAGDKKCCPVCRTTIVIPKPGAKASRNGIFVLEMKLMTKKQGKQAVRA